MMYTLTASEILSIKLCLEDIQDFYDLEEYDHRAVQEALELFDKLTPVNTETFLNYIEEINMAKKLETPIMDQTVATFKEKLAIEGEESAVKFLRESYPEGLPIMVKEQTLDTLPKTEEAVS